MKSENVATLVTEAVANTIRNLKLPQPKSNADRVAMDALVWDTVEALAKAKSEDAWTELAEVATINKDDLAEGETIPYDGTLFAVTAKKTRPIKRFDDDYFANLLMKSKYKVPVMTTKSFLNEAKKDTKGRVTLKVVQKA